MLEVVEIIDENSKEESDMRLPDTNPIDSGWLPRNISIDYEGSERINCVVCNEQTVAETFKFLGSGGFGFGTPFFVAPFLKSRSTRGKTGTRIHIAQCTICKSAFPTDAQSKAWFAERDVAVGLMTEGSALRYLNNLAAAEEASDSEATSNEPNKPKTRKLED